MLMFAWYIYCRSSNSATVKYCLLFTAAKFMKSASYASKSRMLELLDLLRAYVITANKVFANVDFIFASNYLSD